MSCFFVFMGRFHDKFFMNYPPTFGYGLSLKKNQTKIISVLYHRNGLTSINRTGQNAGILKWRADQYYSINWNRMNLVVRRPDAHDRRQQLLSLSERAGTEIKWSR